jgi:hypothetical protein
MTRTIHRSQTARQDLVDAFREPRSVTWLVAKRHAAGFARAAV